MPNQLDTCRCLIVPCVIVFHLSFLTWSATFTSWNCRPRSLHDFSYHDFGFHDFGTPVVRVLDIPNSWYPKSSSFFQDFGVSHFAIPRLLMMKSLDSSNSRYPKLQNGVISRSARLFIYVPLSGFQDSGFRNSGTPVLKGLNS
jgi:hypothetical protein